jgi:hypothetical protein
LISLHPGWEEYRLLQRALNGGATGPGTGIGESLRPSITDLSDVLQLHININNTNDNQIQQTDSGNVAVSQVNAQCKLNSLKKSKKK